MDNTWNFKIQSFFPAITGYATPNTIDKIYEMKLKIKIYLIFIYILGFRKLNNDNIDIINIYIL